MLKSLIKCEFGGQYAYLLTLDYAYGGSDLDQVQVVTLGGALEVERLAGDSASRNPAG